MSDISEEHKERMLMHLKHSMTRTLNKELQGEDLESGKHRAKDLVEEKIKAIFGESDVMKDFDLEVRVDEYDKCLSLVPQNFTTALLLKGVLPKTNVEGKKQYAEAGIRYEWDEENKQITANLLYDPLTG